MKLLMTNKRAALISMCMLMSFFVIIKCGDTLELVDGASDYDKLVFPKGNKTTSFSRKLLGSADESNRAGFPKKCSERDMVIDQGPTPPLPSGIPTYTVTISNACVSGCSISNIHLSCKWYSSARLINPSIFRRLQYDDCLVNDGKPLLAGDSLSFAYANTFPYPMAVTSVACL